MKTTLPIGFHQFHKNNFYNFQLNRWYSEGYAKLEDLKKAALAIKTFDDYKKAFLNLAKEAMAEGRMKNAAFYYRAAEFLIDPKDSDKIPMYDKFIEVFYEAFKDDNIERNKVPYEKGYLPTMRLAPFGDKRGTVLIHGGFDSFIEEFYCFWKLFSEAGYEVIAFDGPGQGGALRKYKIASDHAWEKPTKAVLDYFGLDNVTILGISMGGYWCLRAAAFEKRIKRVIAFPPLFDWMEIANNFMRSIYRAMVKREGLMRASIRMNMRVPQMKHIINNTLFITQKTDAIEVVRWEMAMNKDFLHSELVDQDILLLGGEKDSMQPIILYHKQWKALTHAKSITGHIFTETDQAQNHCGIGNIGLTIEVMLKWLTENNPKS